MRRGRIRARWRFAGWEDDVCGAGESGCGGGGEYWRAEQFAVKGYFDTRLPGQSYFGAEPEALACARMGRGCMWRIWVRMRLR